MSDIYKIYTKCINKNTLNEERFMKILSDINNIVIKYEDKAFLIFRGNNILLLCVDPLYQNKGIGTKLLLAAEKSIKERGYNRSNLGILNDTAFLKGVPYENQEFMFFDNRGYEDTNIVEDKLFDINENFNSSNDVIVGYLKEKDKAIFLEFLNKYDKNLLKEIDPTKNIVVAIKDNQFIAYCQLDLEKYLEFNDYIGLISNLYIFPEYRKSIDASAILKFCSKELVKNNVKEFEINKYNSTMFSEDVKGKTYVKYYVGSKEL